MNADLSPYLNRVICGDCLDVLRGMSDGCVDAVVTDPPYGLSSESAQSLSDRVLNGLLNVVLPNLNEWNPQLAEQIDLHGVPFGGSDLRLREVASIVEARVGVPVSPVHLNGNTKVGQEEVKAGNVAPRGGFTQSVLMDGVNTDGGQCLGDFVLDFGYAAELAGGDGCGCFMPELSFSGFSVPVSPVLFPGSDCPLTRLCLGLAPFCGDGVRLADDALGQAEGSPFILALSGTVNTFMLRFDVRGGAVELFTTYRASQRDAGAELFRPKLVRAGEAASRLPSDFEAVRVRLVGFPTDGAGSFYLHLWLRRGWVSKLNSIIPQGGFMGKSWDAVTPETEIWREALRVAKPGAHLLAFGGTRTHHRLMCAIEDAGWEIRDCLMWVYGSGFPKSLDVSKAIDKAAGVTRTTLGYEERSSQDIRGNSSNGKGISGPAEASKQWKGWGTALKPAFEPVILARKPLEGTVAHNVQKWGTGGINVDGCRVDPGCYVPGAGGSFGLKEGVNEGWKRPAHKNYVPTPSHNKGRFPSNLIHDGSPEVVALFPQSSGQLADVPIDSRKTKDVYGKYDHNSGMKARNDTGSAARFFYCAKSSPSERTKENTHPTVKPIALMRYLCRLITPPGGVVLDPFTGSGSTAIAAYNEGFNWIAIDKKPDYCRMAEDRIKQATAQLNMFHTTNQQEG